MCIKLRLLKILFILPPHITSHYYLLQCLMTKCEGFQNTFNYLQKLDCTSFVYTLNPFSSKSLSLSFSSAKERDTEYYT